MNNMSISQTFETLDEFESYACSRARELPPEDEDELLPVISEHVRDLQNGRRTVYKNHYLLHECRVCHRQLPLDYDKRGWQIDTDNQWICPECNPR